MDFIKKNWTRIILAALCLTCGVLMLIPVFILENFNFTGACQTIGLVLFFMGVAAVFCLTMSDKTKTIGKFILIGTGISALVFLSIGATGLSKTDSQGAIGKAYAYFASVEGTVSDGEITLTEKQAELNAKRKELESAKLDVTGLGLLAQGWSSIVSGFTAEGLFGTMSDGTFVSGVNPATTKIKDIVANPAIVSEHPAYGTVTELTVRKAQVVKAGLGEQTLSSAPYVMGGIVEASAQSFPKLEEAIAQLQGVIDMNAAELSVGKASVKDANAGASTIMFLYICLIIVMGVMPVLVGIKKLIPAKDE